MPSGWYIAVRPNFETSLPSWKQYPQSCREADNDNKMKQFGTWENYS
jgi:hypothetical protein